MSEEKINTVVEGSLYIVFDATRTWYDALNKKIPLEKLYYLSLDALINTAKYLLHPKKPLFRYYVERNITRNIISYIARIEHKTYNEIYEMLNFNELELNIETKEEIEKPSKIYYQIKDQTYNEEFDKALSSEEFMRDYHNIINDLDELDRDVMNLIYDINGNRCMTFKEIADYIGIEEKRVSNIKRKVMKKLKRNKIINQHYQNT